MGTHRNRPGALRARIGDEDPATRIPFALASIKPLGPAPPGSHDSSFHALVLDLFHGAPEIIHGPAGHAVPLAFGAERPEAGVIVIPAQAAAGGAIDLTGRSCALHGHRLVARELARGGRGEGRNGTARTGEQEERRESSKSHRPTLDQTAIARQEVGRLNGEEPEAAVEAC